MFHLNWQNFVNEDWFGWLPFSLIFLNTCAPGPHPTSPFEHGILYICPLSPFFYVPLFPLPLKCVPTPTAPPPLFLVMYLEIGLLLPFMHLEICRIPPQPKKILHVTKKVYNLMNGRVVHFSSFALPRS